MPTIQPKTIGSVKKFLALIAFIALLAGLIYIISFSHFFDIKSWEIVEDGIKITTDERLNQLMQKQKNKNLIFINEEQLTKEIKTIHPEVKKSSSKNCSPQKLELKLKNIQSLLT